MFLSKKSQQILKSICEMEMPWNQRCRQMLAVVAKDRSNSKNSGSDFKLPIRVKPRSKRNDNLPSTELGLK